MRLPVAVKALVAQLAAVSTGFLALPVASSWQIALPDWAVLGIISLSAAGYSRLGGLPLWWLPIQASFVPMLIAMLALDLPPKLFLGLLLILLLIYPSNLKDRVPLYLSNRATWNALLRLLPVDRPFTMIDLGCGNGGGLTYLAGQRPQGRFVGVETAPLPFLMAWMRTRSLRNCQVRWRSLWREDLSGYLVAYAFLSPSPMARLWSKALREMGRDSLFVSNSFEVPGQPPDSVIEVGDGRRTRLLIWRIDKRSAA
ncbi:MAG: class I SAM-dependent methyltransferase [Methylococcaceae bacterium]|nr:class I SAM-dependent methyltransferase [Methylococcaceae bacterium]